MWKTLVALAVLASMSGCSLIGAGIGAATARHPGDGAIEGGLIGASLDLTVWSSLGTLGAYPGSICAAPEDVAQPRRTP